MKRFHVFFITNYCLQPTVGKSFNHKFLTVRPPVTSSCWFKRRSSSCWFERRSSMSESSMLLLAGLVLLLLLLVWRRRGVRGLPLPPGPTGLPLLGNLPQVDKRAPFKTFMKVRYMHVLYFYSISPLHFTLDKIISLQT